MSDEFCKRRPRLRKAQSASLKYRARLFVVPLLARIGRLVGISWRSLGKVLGREVLIAQLAQLNRNCSAKPNEKKLKTVFLSMIGGHSHNMSVEAVLAMGLKARGHPVKFVICDQALPVCEVKKAGQENNWAKACGKCYSFGRKYLEALDTDVSLVSELKNQTPASGKVWTEIVDAALLKHFRVGKLVDQPVTRARRAEFEEAAKTSDRVGTSIVELKPDRVVMSHGIYTTWGPQRQILLDAGIPVVTYGKGKKRSTQKFNWSTSSDWWDVSQEWEIRKNVPLNVEEEAAIDSYLASRRDHSQDTLVYNFGEEESKESIAIRLKLDPKKRTVVLFTNVLWDAASAQREIVFRDPIDWVFQTIRWFAANPNVQLVVKIHPAETVIGTKQPFASIIAEEFEQLPDNVRIVLPDGDFNSWSFLNIADLGLVHTSTVGLELALAGIPCVVVSRTHYRGKGLTIDVESPEEYFDILSTGGAKEWDRNEIAELTKRYFYLLFERYQFPWNVLFEVAHTDTRCFSVDSIEHIVNNPSINAWMKSFENGSPFLLPAHSD